MELKDLAIRTLLKQRMTRNDKRGIKKRNLDNAVIYMGYYVNRIARNKVSITCDGMGQEDTWSCAKEHLGSTKVLR